ncbi:response regulator [Paenibacillus sp. NFR01]|uniref:response regulator n=1 Tax=Paenibacillus sp. NFR01 TaxID=1566279 RepID=UPI0008D75B1C|nr:response regulator [Paenibacillus sp. NFR01]SET91674.1 two-component system, response regulator YesN [Paenibacillus sp. NFR01]
MKKVMLVDDEISIRENIRDCVNWEKEGFIYCGDAPDGEVALPLIEEWSPDILITDIKMPFMNGLELSSVVRQRMPETKIIILSGHDDFQYAQKALRLGVEDYCLKPVSSADLVGLLHAASAQIDKEREARRMEAYTPGKLLADLCGGLIGTAAAIEAAAQLDMPLSASCYAVAIFAVHGVGPQQPEPAPSNLGLLEETLGERLRMAGDGYVFKRSRSETVWIVKGNHPGKLTGLLEKDGAQIAAELGNSFGCEVTISTGSAKERLLGVHLSYLEAEENLVWRRMARQNKSSLFESSLNADSQAVLLDRNQIVDFMKVGSAAEAPAFLQTFTAAFDRINWNSMYAFYLINDLTLELVHSANLTFQPAENPAALVQSLQPAIRKITNVQDGIRYLRQLLERLWQWRYEGAGKYSELLSKVKLHIRENYADDQLSLNEISRQIGVSSSHLSKIFSQETGQTMTEYLTATRIAKAKELLKTTNCKTLEIAYRVGYNDQHYFSNLFKKITGMTPIEYRKQGLYQPQGGQPGERGNTADG